MAGRVEGVVERAAAEEVGWVAVGVRAVDATVPRVVCVVCDEAVMELARGEAAVMGVAAMGSARAVEVRAAEAAMVGAVVWVTAAAAAGAAAAARAAARAQGGQRSRAPRPL